MEKTATFSDLARRFELHLRSYRGASPRTCESYGAAYGRFQRHLASTGLGDDVRHFTPEVCQAYAQARLNDGLSPNSLGPELSALASLARWGKVGLGDFERPRRQKVEKRFLRPDELRIYCRAPASEREALLRALTLATTLRASELAGLNVEDAYEDAAGRLCLSVSVKGRQGERRAVPLPAEVATLLLASVRSRRALPGAPLLVNSQGERYTRQSLSETLLTLGRRAGISRLPVRAHVFRHTLNTIGRAAGLDVQARAALLNHASTQTLQHYDHLLPEETAAARETLWAAVKEATA